MADMMIRADGLLSPGTPVEVRARFDRGWKRGFAIDTAEAEGYRVRRLSDGWVLPAVFPADEVRPADQPGWG